MSELLSPPEDLLEALQMAGFRPPDWCFLATILDISERRDTGERVPFKYSTKDLVPGVYMFLDTNSDTWEAIPLYVGKAAYPWNRMQQHWCQPSPWLSRYFDDVDRSLGEEFDRKPQEPLSLDGAPYVCAWREDLRSAVEAAMIKSFKPRYNQRNE